MRLDDALIEFLDEQAVSLRDRTVDALTRAAKRWSERWLDAELGDLDHDRIREFLVAYRSDHSGSTANQEKAYLGWFFRWALRRKYVRENPAVDLPRFPETRRTARTLDDGEFERLLAAAEPQAQAIILLAVETGLRRSTLLALRWEWLDMEGGWVHVDGRHMKGRADYHAPLSERALGALRSIRDAVSGPVWPLGRSTLHRYFDLARKRAGVDCVFHDLRRTFFTQMRQKGVPIEVAMALSAHRDVKTALAHYRCISPEEMLQAVGRGPAKRKGASCS